jgi:hypothetical protein
MEKMPITADGLEKLRTELLYLKKNRETQQHQGHS